MSTMWACWAPLVHTASSLKSVHTAVQFGSVPDMRDKSDKHGTERTVM